jgi:hypothetical protein
MRRLLPPQWLLHPRILIFPIDKPQNVRIHITSVKAHFVLSSISRRRLKRPPIQSTLRKSLPIKWDGNCLTYTHPQLSQWLMWSGSRETMTVIAPQWQLERMGVDSSAMLSGPDTCVKTLGTLLLDDCIFNTTLPTSNIHTTRVR